MRVTIKNGNEWQRTHAKGFAKWYETKYLAAISRELFLRIHILPYEDGTNIGECENVEDKSKNPRKFLIKIGATEEMSKREFIMALAHEMVHLKQYALNELRDDNDRRVTMFKRKPYSFDMEYWEMPWEIEAFGMERGLLHRYAMHADFYDEVVKHAYD
jgi:hypothetical protein